MDVTRRILFNFDSLLTFSFVLALAYDAFLSLVV